MEAAGAAAEAAAEEEERRGTLVALRRCSARLVFGDLECDGGAACALVFKATRWCGRESAWSDAVWPPR